jgi:hypothetical protein
VCVWAKLQCEAVGVDTVYSKARRHTLFYFYSFK